MYVKGVEQMIFKDFKGNEFISIKEMCDMYGINYKTYMGRRNKGMSVKEALTTPLYTRMNMPKEYEYPEIPPMCIEEEMLESLGIVDFKIEYDTKYNKPYLRLHFDDPVQFEGMLNTLENMITTLERKGIDPKYIIKACDWMQETFQWSNFEKSYISSLWASWALRAFPYIIRAFAEEIGCDCPDFININKQEDRYI